VVWADGYPDPVSLEFLEGAGVELVNLSPEAAS
jgi:hypothetical protein